MSTKGLMDARVIMHRLNAPRQTMSTDNAARTGLCFSLLLLLLLLLPLFYAPLALDREEPRDLSRAEAPPLK